MSNFRYQLIHATGQDIWFAYVNGKIHIGNPRTISLGSYVVIQLDVGSPVVAFQRPAVEDLHHGLAAVHDK